MGHIIVAKTKYYYFDSYNSWNDAYEVARKYKRMKCKYFILQKEFGFLFPELKYVLYLNKYRNLL